MWTSKTLPLQYNGLDGSLHEQTNKLLGLFMVTITLDDRIITYQKNKQFGECITILWEQGAPEHIWLSDDNACGITGVLDYLKCDLLVAALDKAFTSLETATAC